MRIYLAFHGIQFTGRPFPNHASRYSGMYGMARNPQKVQDMERNPIWRRLNPIGVWHDMAYPLCHHCVTACGISDMGRDGINVIMSTSSAGWN